MEKKLLPKGMNSTTSLYIEIVAKNTKTHYRGVGWNSSQEINFTTHLYIEVFAKNANTQHRGVERILSHKA